jgi:hypothetical protein
VISNAAAAAEASGEQGVQVTDTHVRVGYNLHVDSCAEGPLGDRHLLLPPRRRDRGDGDLHALPASH